MFDRHAMNTAAKNRYYQTGELRGTQALGDLGLFVDGSEGGFLVRHGDVAAPEAELRQRAQRLKEILRPDGQRQVGAIDAVFGEPEAVQARRQ